MWRGHVGMSGPSVFWADQCMQTGRGEGLYQAERWSNAQPYWHFDAAYEYGLAVVDDFGDIVPVIVFHK